MSIMRRLTCRTLACHLPQPRTTEEREYLHHWQAGRLADHLEAQADSRDEDRDGDAELGGMQQ